MVKGIVFAITACFIWGLIYVVPLFMEGFSAIEVTLGRYFFYGMISSTLLMRSRLKGLCCYPLSIWLKVFYFSFFSSIGYYTFVILGLRYSTAPICALVLGISPITIAFYGNWQQRECSFKSLIIPSLLILAGLLIINIPQLIESASPTTYILGLACILWALIAWTWYAVANAQFLKRHPEVASSDWSTLIGVGSIGWALVLGCILALFFDEHIVSEKYMSLNADLSAFLLGSAALGFLCSWVAGFLWNRASVYLPVSLAGQLMIFETIFGLLFIYIIEQRIPPVAELMGIFLFFVAIVYGISNLRDENSAFEKIA